MSIDQLSLIVQRGMTDPDFVSRAVADLDGTLAAEGIRLSPDEMAAVREFQGQISGLSEDEVMARLTDAARTQSAC